MLRFLYCEPWRDEYPRATPGQLGAGYAALSLLGRLLDDYPWARGALLQFAMKMGFAAGPDVDDPSVYGSWGEGLDTHRPMADLFNASVTIDRADLARAFERICAVYARYGGSTVVTVRLDRKSVRQGKSVSVRVDIGGSRMIHKKNMKRNKMNSPMSSYRAELI